MTPAPDADDLWGVDVPERLAMVFGAEGPGLTARRCAEPIDGCASRSVGDVDSINVGHAAAVTFAATRRR